MKLCARCKVEKPRDGFNKSKRFKDGLRTWCKPCERSAALAWRNANRDRAIASAKRWHDENVERDRQYRKRQYSETREEQIRKSVEWARNNPAKLNASRKRYRERHRQELRDKAFSYAAQRREHYAANARKWVRDNRGRANATRRQREIGERRATPRWVNDFFVSEIYELAGLRTQYTGVRHEVDHVVPVRSPAVCGLHWEVNLRVVTFAENRAKSNSTWPDMPARAC